MKNKNILLLGLILILFFSCSKKNNAGLNKLIIFHAGSLSVPMKEITEAYKAENPGVEILIESAGSRTCARMISELNKDCDIFASADYEVIDELLIPDFAKWNIKFAANEMVIAYTEKSKYKDDINTNNWHEILLKKDVIFGRSDPNADPCGYRTVLTMKLADAFYNNTEISSNIIKKNINFIRPKETDLLALLECNAVDYIFIYKSVVEQHGLKYISLPDEINLKNPELSELYKTASVEVAGKKPGEITVITGTPMVYGITLVEKTKNRKEAINFLKFLLTKEKGMAIMEKNGQPSLIPTGTETYNAIPKELKKFAKPEE